MKKTVLSLLIAFAGLTSSAQETKFGVKAGLNLASLNSSDLEKHTSDSKGRIGLHIGAFVEIPLSEKMALQPELLYSMQGKKYEYKEDGDIGEDNLKLDYINLPIMFKYYVIENLSVEAGPQIGYLLSAKDEYSYSGISDSDSGEYDLTKYDDIKKLAIAFNIGVGYNITENLSVNLRYSLGLNNINGDKKVKENDDWGEYEHEGYIDNKYSIKSNVFQLSVGYKF